jgi:DNA-binding NarL/FixJ family response regulator
MTKIRVALIEDHDLTRTALRTTLQDHPDLEWVGEASNGKEGIELLQKMQPEVAIVDIGLPDIDGIELTKQLKAEEYPGKILILTLHDSEDDVLTAFLSGADAYCMKTSSIESLLEAIKATYEGNSWIDPSIAKIVLSQVNQGYISSGSTKKKNRFDITERELEVLKLIVEGCSNSEIAERLMITIGTVKTHVRNILTKLSATDRTQAAVRALRSGLVK